MGFLEKLSEASTLPNVYYHKFIISYKKESNDIFVFCEGQADLSYYCEQISRICSDKEIHKFPVECKNNVLQIQKYIDWNEFQKKRVLFFVDRDLSYWVDEPQIYDTNVYMTDGYSFENDAINCFMFTKLLEDIYGFANYSSAEKQGIENLYIKKWDAFVEGSYELMAYILYKYQYFHKHTAQGLNIRTCLNIGEECIWKKSINNLAYEDYIRNKLEIGSENITEIIKKYQERFIEEDAHYSIRGKWCLEFMICLMDHVLENGQKFAPSLYNGVTKQPKKMVELTSRGAMITIGPKVKPAESLLTFLISNVKDNDE